ncbi:glycosyltransferase family 4 protein [Terrabacter sp. Ter38]|uniref:glycosyltransferase family 4 protein n=1 Tax=Terrabacter sp. Ter38 TaxID=2926030 RepID=UPI0021176C42|nr:glycosyltransferase family 4 protein [Terrabacter sp. Ter38]
MLCESVQGLVESGHRVVVALPSDGPLVAQLENRGAECRVLAMPVLRKAALRPRGFLSLVATLLRSAGPTAALLREVRPVAVYVSTQTIPSWVLAGRLAQARTVCHVHEAERHPSGMIERGMVWPLAAAHRVLANSEYSARVLTDVLPRLAGRSQVVPNGVAGPDSSHSSPARADLGGTVRLLFVGRLSPRKGPDVAVRAVRELRGRGIPASIGLLGDVFAGYEWFERDLRTQAADLVDVDAVSFLGFRSSVWETIESHDVVVVPSTQPEPFGNTAVEAVLAGRPVVVSRTGGLPEAVAGVASAVVVEPGDAEALADAVAQVVADWPGFVERAEAARKPAGERFSPQRYRRAVAQAVDGGPGADAPLATERLVSADS